MSKNLRKSKMRFFYILFVLAMTLALVPTTTFAAPGSNSQAKSKLDKLDRQLIADAKANGQSTVTLLIAAVKGSNSALTSQIASLGGTVRYKEDSLDYIRVAVAIDKVDAVANLSNVQAVDVDQVIPISLPAPEATPNTTEAVPPPDQNTPRSNGYLPANDIKAVDFKNAHPTFDGRNVTIGLVDTGVDLAHPSLQTTTTGERKVVDWVTGTDPFTDDDPTWINMQDQVSGSAFAYKGVTYTAPAAGSYRIGLFNERDPRLGGEIGNDVNRDGNPKGSSGIFAVLWNTGSNTVYVDTNQDQNFSNDMAMADYKVNYDINYFGTDNPSTAVAERMPFVVQTDGKDKFVNIGIVSGEHATHVAGIMAGKGFFNGAFDGVAPGAKIVSLRACMFVTGCTAHALFEGMIFVAKQSNVDVINMSIGGLPALNDGNNARAQLYDRLIEQYNVQMFISAGNDGPGLNTVGDPAVATKVMAIGASVTKDSWYDNYGAIATKNEGLFVFSSRGPREDGGFKPDVVAPGSAISGIPTWKQGEPVGGTYNLPPGYGMLNGTSMAAPEATGAGALLVSAAKQSGVQKQPAQLRQAMKSSADFLDGYQAYEQGNGRLNVVNAWGLLKTNIKTNDVDSSAPVNTIISQFLATPNMGKGIYEREGWAAGQTGTRLITFTRTSGGGGTKTFNLSWVGNDGTFTTSAGSIALPLNKPVALSVSINPATAGVHSAILNVDDPTTTGIDYQTLNTVVAAEQFNAANNFSVSVNGSVDRPEKLSYFFNVPAKTPAFKVDLTGVTGRLRVMRFHPYGIGIDNATAGYQTGGTQSLSLSNPQAGVWEVTVDASRTSPNDPSTFTLTASILGVDVTPASWVIDPATVATTYNQGYSFTNRFGSFNGGAVGTALGSAFSDRPSIASGANPKQYVINVQAGSTSLSARIGNASDNAADLDLYLYDCTTGSCVLKAQSTSGTAEESVSVKNPTAGIWVALVDPYSVPSGDTAYDYLDVFANPAFGSVSVTDPVATHGNNTTWNAPASVTPSAVPGSNRYLQGFVQVVSGSVVLGSGAVELKNVAPQA